MRMPPAREMTRKTITRAASPSPESPSGPGSCVISWPPRRWRVIWDMFTDAKPCLSVAASRGVPQPGAPRGEKRNIYACRRRFRTRNVSQRFNTNSNFSGEGIRPLRVRNYVTENPLTREERQSVEHGRFSVRAGKIFLFETHGSWRKHVRGQPRQEHLTSLYTRVCQIAAT